jgi:glycosyltransferase involved in cell wall biosynthesis
MISIVIPTLNERLHIGALLDSIAAQDITEGIEVVVADKHSSDGTPDIARSYAHRFRVIIAEGGMPAVARNSGARASSGDPILFLDADMTLPDPEFLRKNVADFRKRHLGVAASPLIPDGANITDKVFAWISNTIMRIAQYIRPVGAQSIMVSRETYLKSGGYPEDRVLFEDHDFVGACSRHGRYGVMPVPARFSVRRLEKEGRTVIAWKYTYAALYRMIAGPITKPIFEYAFNETPVSSHAHTNHEP